jgi:hypothetical protein
MSSPRVVPVEIFELDIAMVSDAVISLLESASQIKRLYKVQKVNRLCTKWFEV